MREPRSPSLRLRRLAAELRRARESADYTVTRTAKELGWSPPKVSKMETTETKRINAADLDKLLDLYKITDQETRTAMQALARDARERGWWAKYKGLFGDRALADFEAEASSIRTFEALCIPGLLQTPEYAEALFEGGRYTSAAEIRNRVEYRMARREILTRFSPARLRAVLDEAALRRLIGGPEVMRGQLDHLLHMAQMPNIDVQIVPFGAGSHAGLTSPFMILDFPEPLDTPIVWIGTLAGSVFLEQEEEIGRYTVTFGDLQGSALSTKQSAEFIKDVAASLRE